MASPLHLSTHMIPALAVLLLLLPASAAFHVPSFLPRSSLSLHPSPSASPLLPSRSTSAARRGGAFAARCDLAGWAKDNGVQAGVLELATFEGGLRGMKARKAVESGQDLIAVPDDLAIRVIGDTPSYPSKTLVDMCSKDAWKVLPWYARLALLIVAEQRMVSGGEECKREEWVQALPKSLPTPLHWSDDQLMAVGYQGLINSVRAQRSKWRSLYDSVKRSASKPPSESEFYHACELARSRAFSGEYTAPLPKEQFFLLGLLIACSEQFNLMPGGTAFFGGALAVAALFAQSLVLPRILGIQHYVVCPVIDMLNHDTAESSEVTYAPFQKSFVVVASKAYGRDKQVYISYGSRSNDQLLQYYGFVEKDNPNDVYQITDIASALKPFLPDVTTDKLMLEREKG
eukprot:CAMPEP_0169447746 /NCGR_PEP_ID=MMETSP1042-20121227/11678_1 /TAXON_ID=464988 /ORGANISM="Hemiselmis andersenii, Strain CCMP1180" /LENGTH=401 /DNA_ID=CAMNT_0009559311 /DNA_START=47 /DNA_END=1249 /DNA_ORIENTATION=-